MPISLQTGLTMQEIESILAHELAHIRRNDYLINVFQSVAEILFFYHPATWWISGIIRDERENCCDDMAVSILGDSMAYSRTLARMNELTVKQTYTQTALAFNGKKGSLLGRIKRLFTHKNENNVLAERFAAVTIILAAMLVSLTANAGLVANKAVQLVREVNNQMPSMTSFESDNSGNWASENWDSSLSDTTKKKKKLFITIDENGKADTVVQFDNQDAFPPMPPMPPLPPMPPMPPDFPDMEDLEDIDIDVDFDDEKAMNHSRNATVQVLDGKNGKVVIVNGKKFDIDSISKNAKTVNVDNENGKVRIIIDGKVAKTIDVDKIRKDVRIHKVYRNSFAPFDQNSRQNSKSFDSLKNTKEYKKKREKYEKALKDYQELMKEYSDKLPKDKSGNFKNTDEWRAYAEAQRDYQEAVREQQQEVIEQQQEIREQQREVIREQRMTQRDQERAEREQARAEKERVKNEERLVKVKAELAKDGFKTDKFKIKINAETVEINDNKVSPELEKKYRSLFDWNENKKGTMTMEIN
jgi:IS1 family transposase